VFFSVTFFYFSAAKRAAAGSNQARHFSSLDGIARPEQVCPNMPQHAFEMLGRLEAPEYAMPQLPQHAPTQISMKGAENSSFCHAQAALLFSV